MFRSDLFWLLPAILVALFQVKWIWRRLPEPRAVDTIVAGDYKEQDLFRLDYLMYLTYFILIIQLMVPLFAITDSAIFTFWLRIGGYILVISGFIASMLALKKLGDNWTGMFYYRIKKKQQLVTSGVYSLIRHPIYSAVLVELLGFELIANSWISLILLISGFWIFYKHSQKEEKLLKQAFGSEFVSYKKRTKLFLPWLI